MKITIKFDPRFSPVDNDDLIEYIQEIVERWINPNSRISVRTDTGAELRWPLPLKK